MPDLEITVQSALKELKAQLHAMRHQFPKIVKPGDTLTLTFKIMNNTGALDRSLGAEPPNEGGKPKHDDKRNVEEE